MYTLTEEQRWHIIKQKVKSKKLQSQNELENAVDQALYNLSLNVVQSCIKKRLKQYIHMLYRHINFSLVFCTAKLALSEYIQEILF